MVDRAMDDPSHAPAAILPGEYAGGPTNISAQESASFGAHTGMMATDERVSMPSTPGQHSEPESPGDAAHARGSHGGGPGGAVHMSEHERAMVHMVHRLGNVELQVANTNVQQLQRISDVDARVSGVRDRIDTVGDTLQGLAVTSRKTEQALSEVNEEMCRHIEHMTKESHVFRARLDAVVVTPRADTEMDDIDADVRKWGMRTNVIEHDINELRNLCAMHATASDLRDATMTSMQSGLEALEARMAALESRPRTPRSGSSMRRRSKLPPLDEDVDEDEGYDPGDSLMSVVSQKPIRIDFPKEAEIVRFRTDMTRESLHAKLPELKADMCDRHEKLEELFALPASEWRAQLQIDAQLLEADRFARR